MTTAAWLAWSALVTVLALTVTNPLYLALVLICVVGVGLAGGREESSPLRPLLAAGAGVLAFSALVTIVNGTPGREVLFTVPGPDAPSWLGGLRFGGPVTREGLVAAATRALGLLCIFGAFAVVTMAVSPARLLRAAPAPVAQAGLVLTIGLALLPATLDDLRRLREADALRGREPRWWRLPALVTPAVLGGLDRAIRLAEALEARGFGGARPIPRTALLGGAAALPLMLVAAYLWIAGGVYRPAAGGPALLALGGLALWARGSRAGLRPTRLRPEPAGPAAWGAVAACVAVAAIASAAAAAHAAALTHDAFAGPAMPGFTALGALVAIAPIWPILVKGRAAPLTLTHEPGSGQGTTPPPGPPGHTPDRPGGAARSTQHAASRSIPHATVRGLTYRYPTSSQDALSNVHLDVVPGEFALLAGASAGGKSTLLRAINGLVPQFYGGTYRGSVMVGGLDAARTPARRLAHSVGLVFQEPEAQAVADTVEEEVAFGLEQQGVGRSRMECRVAEALALTGIAALRDRRLVTLSGGERQRVAIAAVLALRPGLLLLDEPTSQLDPTAAAAVIDCVERLSREEGHTVLIAEHRLERLLPAADRLIHVQDGRLVAGRPAQMAARLPSAPPVVRLGQRLGLSPLPLDPRAARDAIAATGRRPCASRLSARPAPGDLLLRLEGLSVRLADTQALRGASLDLREGEVVALVGANGSGKSTLLRAVAGSVPSEPGSVEYAGRAAPATLKLRTAFAGLCPQDPAVVLAGESCADEVARTLAARRLRDEPASVLASWGLAGLEGRDPRDLSAGQRQRLATAAMLAHSPRVWLLDEPTRGADAETQRWLEDRLAAHAAAGGAAIVATHDIEAAARFATRVVGLEVGEIAFDLPVAVALGTGGRHPTQTAQVVPGGLVPEDVRW